MKNKSLTLSIVIPVYNEENYLKACLDSIASQSEMPDEVIVVNNNSSDRSAAICQDYAFVNVIRETKQGIVFSRNRGFDEAKSELIGRIDADTVLDSRWVSLAKSFFDEHEKTAAITGSCYFYDFPLRRFVHILHTAVYYGLQKLIAGTDVLWGSNMVIRSAAWRQVRSLCHNTDKGHEDVDLSLCLKKKSLRIARYGKIRAEVSMRRGELGLKSLTRYLARWHRTYILNCLYIRVIFIFILEGLTIIGAILAMPINLFSRK